MVSYDVDGRRVLELGCGLGLSSLVLQKRQVDITATDRHPEAQRFLQRNAALNSLPEIPFVRAGWADSDDGWDDRFDLIIGSDVLYEREQAEMLEAFIGRRAAPTCEIVLIDPGRGHHARFSKAMVRRGYTHQQRPEALHTGGTKPAQVLTYRRSSG